MSQISAHSGPATSSLPAFRRPAILILQFFTHYALLAFALISIMTMQAWRWIDVRFLGPFGDALVLAWLASLLAITWLQIFPTAKFPSEAIPAEVLRRRRYMQWLLIPTALLLAVLLFNSIIYYELYFGNRIDVLPCPMSLLIIIFIAFWLLLRPWNLRLFIPDGRAKPAASVSGAPETTAAALPRGPLSAVAALAFLFYLLALAWIFFFAFDASPPPPHQKLDLAVVFGHRVLANGQASVTLRYRTMKAVQLFQQHRVRYIMVSGAIDPVGTSAQGKTLYQSEAVAMLNVCRHHGIPSDRIFVDPVGHNTRTSVYDAKMVMQRHHLHSVVGISSDYHLPRIRMAFAQMGIHAYTLAAKPTQWTETEPYSLLRELVGYPVYYFDRHYHEPEVEKMDVKNPRLVVYKSRHALDLFDGTRLVKTYACITGLNSGDKQVEGDKKTPLGNRRIVYKNPESKYHLSMGLNYPDAADALRGYKAGLLTRPAYEKLVELLARGNMNDTTVQDEVWKTPLGGEIFIHGCADHRAGTAGCVALSNADIEQLYAICHVGTQVEILP